MSYKMLSLDGFIQEMKDVTNGSHPRRFCFVLGAGASKESGIKTGQELVAAWDKELYQRNKDDYEQWREKLGITDNNMANFYSQYYEKRFCRCPSDGLNFLERIMESAEPSTGYIMLSFILATTPHNVVVTTNFDHLTEDSVNHYAHKIPLVIGHEALSNYAVGLQTRPTIIKIHRDLLFDPKNASKDVEDLADGWKKALSRIFEHYHPVFIGYAGNDKSLMNFLMDNRSKFSSNKWKYPYWMLLNTDTLSDKVSEFLNECEGYCILHSGFDGVMIQIGAKLGCTLPSEEEFLKDAKSCYKKLKEAINNYTASNDILISEAMAGRDQREVNAVYTERLEDLNKIHSALAEVKGNSFDKAIRSGESRYPDSVKREAASAVLSRALKELNTRPPERGSKRTLSGTINRSGKYGVRGKINRM